MKQKEKIITLALAFILLYAFTAVAEPQSTKGDISKVTVYHGQALVTRTIMIDLPEGSSEIVVTDLPARIVPESIYAQTGNDTKVLSVRYRSRAVESDTREEVKKIDTEIEEVKKQQYQAKRDKDIACWSFRSFEAIWKWTVDTTNVDLNRSMLEAGPIENLSAYLEEKAIQWHNKTVEIEFRQQELAKQLELLERKRQELANERSRTERDAILYISRSDEGKSQIELNYLVNNADWIPQYNLRANPEKSDVLIEYNAVINQTSGEDWPAVALSLSTAEPSMVASAPTLEALNVGIGPRITAQPAPDMQQQAFDGFPAGDFKQLLRSRRETARKGKTAQRELSQLAVSNQLLEFNIKRNELRQLKEQMAEITRVEGISVTYELPGKLTLPSRSDQQLITVASIRTKAEFTLVATPLLTDYVYLQADLVNNSDTVLLPGQASVFRDGQFVGKNQMGVVTMGEKFTAGFGIDSQIQVARELEDKQTRIQGGNRIETFHYRIALENYKDSPVKLRLVDRLPFTKDKAVKIELGENSHDLSTDKEYLRSQRKNGLLRWDMELEPKTTDEKATIVTYTYTMEYDKNMEIQPIRK